MKQNIYDIKTFSEAYDKMRYENKGMNANDLIEIPNFRKLIPNLSNKKVLDLGCGYGENDIYCKALGSKEVLGIDISKHMLNIALTNNKDKDITYKLMAMEDIDKLEDKFDVVISSLAIHYVKDYDKLIKDIYNLLEQTIKYNEPINISTKNGNAVVLSEEDYNNLMATLEIENNKKLKEDIEKGMKEYINDSKEESEVNW